MASTGNYGPYARIIDYGRCMGCGTCEEVCKFIHDDNLPRIRVIEVTSGLLKPISCLHCYRAPCVEACPTGAMRRDEKGAVYVEESKCIGCMACLYACPFGVPEVHPMNGTSLKCDLCRDLIAGGASMPGCVAMCPAEAILYGSPQELAQEMKKRALANLLGIPQG